MALLAHASPLTESKPAPAPVDLEKRAVTCHTTGSNVKYCRGPRTSCDAVGQYGAKGTRVSVTCFNRGERINNNPYVPPAGLGCGKKMLTATR